MVEIVRLSISGIMRDIPQVTINPEELEWAAYAGIIRHRAARRRGSKRPDGTVATEEDDKLGAVGEFIASLVIGCPWRGPGKFRGDDVEGGFQVRTISSPTHRLIIQPRDSDDSPFILIRGTGNPYVWQAPGWILGREAKQDIYWENPAGLLHSYYVDQAALHPMSSLNRVLLPRTS